MSMDIQNLFNTNPLDQADTNSTYQITETFASIFSSISTELAENSNTITIRKQLTAISIFSLTLLKDKKTVEREPSLMEGIKSIHELLEKLIKLLNVEPLNKEEQSLIEQLRQNDDPFDSQIISIITKSLTLTQHINYTDKDEIPDEVNLTITELDIATHELIHTTQKNKALSDIFSNNDTMDPQKIQQNLHRMITKTTQQLSSGFNVFNTNENNNSPDIFGTTQNFFPDTDTAGLF